MQYFARIPGLAAFSPEIAPQHRLAARLRPKALSHHQHLWMLARARASIRSSSSSWQCNRARPMYRNDSLCADCVTRKESPSSTPHVARATIARNAQENLQKTAGGQERKRRGPRCKQSNLEYRKSSIIFLLRRAFLSYSSSYDVIRRTSGRSAIVDHVTLSTRLSSRSRRSRPIVLLCHLPL